MQNLTNSRSLTNSQEVQKQEVQGVQEESQSEVNTTSIGDELGEGVGIQEPSNKEATFTGDTMGVRKTTSLQSEELSTRSCDDKGSRGSRVSSSVVWQQSQRG